MPLLVLDSDLCDGDDEVLTALDLSVFDARLSAPLSFALSDAADADNGVDRLHAAAAIAVDKSKSTDSNIAFDGRCSLLLLAEEEDKEERDREQKKEYVSAKRETHSHTHTYIIKSSMCGREQQCGIIVTDASSSNDRAKRKLIPAEERTAAASTDESRLTIETLFTC